MTDAVAFRVVKGKTTLEEWAVEVGGVVTPLEAVPAEPAVVFTLTPELATALRAGELDVNVGFMRGQVKMSGDNAALLRVLPELRTYRG
jgi:hypothetical protein